MQNRNQMLISFAISIFFWWMMPGSLNMALGFLALIMVHEMGHYIFAKHVGVPVGLPQITPLGGDVELKEKPASAKEEAFVAIGGPVLGTIGGLLTLALGKVLGIPQLYYLAQYALVLQLLNMIPLAPLDGGRVSMAIERRLWILGVPMLLYAMTQIFGLNSFNLLMTVLILWGAWADVQNRQKDAAENPAYYDVGFSTRVGYFLTYAGLGGFLLFAVNNIPMLIKWLVALGI